MKDIQIRKATLSDVDRLCEISRTTFHETFSADNSEANMKKYFDNSFSEASLSLELNNPDSRFYFAVAGTQIIGYVKINSGPAQTELQNENAVELERIYVAKEFQGRKIGQLLLEKALQIAQQRNADFVWLGVWEKNHRAIRFYQKNGFVAFDKHIFVLGDDHQTDILMKRNLKTGQ